jgi:leucyl/phenylalanyl-tRNA--protein transferase
MYRIHWLSRHDPPDAFPDPVRALRDPDGLLAAGGDLSVERLLAAYERGIFPWYEEGQPVLWWSPDPRAVLFPGAVHVSRSLRRSLRRRGFVITWNRAFRRVMSACAQPRPGQYGTWITAAMEEAFVELHDLGWAHSIEIWQGDELAGGLYGLAIGRVFFGESMFSEQTDASKTAMVALDAELTRRGFALIDCQVVSPHLLSMGAETIPRRAFLDLLRRYCSDREKPASPPAEPLPAQELAARERVANGV